MLPVTLSRVINFVFYQVGWLCCVLSVEYGVPVSGSLMALALIAVHLLLADERKAEVQLMLSALLIGTIVDSLQQSAGLFTFEIDSSWPLWLPLWIFVIWAQFATLFRFALHWLYRRYLLGALCGAVGGPLAYWGGMRLGAATFGDSPLLTLAILAVVWALVMPLLLWLNQWYGGGAGRYRKPLEMKI